MWEEYNGDDGDYPSEIYGSANATIRIDESDYEYDVATNGSRRFSLNSTNASVVGGPLPDDMRFGEANIISICVYSVLFVLSGVLNLLVLSNLLRKEARRSVGLSRLNSLLLHLVLADLSVTFLMMPLEIGWAATVSWRAGDFLCRIFSFFRIFGLFLSSNVVMCISIDRFLAILKPFSVRSSSERTNRMLFAAWALAFLLSLPQCWVFKLRYHPRFPWYGQCVTYGSFNSRSGEFLYFFLGMVFLYVLPLIVIIFTYGGIVLHLHKVGSTKRSVAEAVTAAAGVVNGIQLAAIPTAVNGGGYDMFIGNGNGHNKSNDFVRKDRPHVADPHHDHPDQVPLRQSAPGMVGKAKMNTIKITLTLVGVFLACWTPYYVICLWYWAAPDSFDKVDVRLRKFLFLFACTNSCANPLIYGMFTSKSGSGGVFASRERDVATSEQGRRGWIGTMKVRLAARRRSCYQDENQQYRVDVPERCSRLRRLFAAAATDIPVPCGNGDCGGGGDGVRNYLGAERHVKSAGDVASGGDLNGDGVVLDGVLDTLVTGTAVASRTTPTNGDGKDGSGDGRSCGGITVLKKSDTFI